MTTNNSNHKKLNWKGLHYTHIHTHGRTPHACTTHTHTHTNTTHTRARAHTRTSTRARAHARTHTHTHTHTHTTHVGTTVVKWKVLVITKGAYRWCSKWGQAELHDTTVNSRCPLCLCTYTICFRQEQGILADSVNLVFLCPVKWRSLSDFGRFTKMMMKLRRRRIAFRMCQSVITKLSCRNGRS